MIQKYNPETKSLEQPVEYKVRKIIELNRLVKQAEDRWHCIPIPGYNSTTYVITRGANGWICNCQGFSKKNTCSHERALLIILERAGHKDQLSLF